MWLAGSHSLLYHSHLIPLIQNLKYAFVFTYGPRSAATKTSAANLWRKEAELVVDESSRTNIEDKLDKARAKMRVTPNEGEHLLRPLIENALLLLYHTTA